MAQAPTKHQAQSLSSINRRVGHITVAYQHFVVVWGGFMADSENSDHNSYCPTDSVWLYNTHAEIWTRVVTKGQAPLRSSGATGLVLNDCLYLFGGIPAYPNMAWCYSNNLFRLNLKTFTWEHLEPSGEPPLPCDKGAGWVYEDRLYFFGGYGERPQNSHGKFSFSLDIGNFEADRGWNNQLSCYDPQSNAWIDFKAKGIAPTPRAAHAADISGDLVYIFGGRFGEVRNNDMYALDMKTLTWKHNLNDGIPLAYKPSGRSWHSFNFIAPNHGIVYGGLRTPDHPSMCWCECFINKKLEIRWKHGRMSHPLVWHKSAFVPSTGELVIVGGILRSPYSMTLRDHIIKPTILHFQPKSLLRLCLDTLLEMGNPCKYTLMIPNCLNDVLLRRHSQTIETRQSLLSDR